MTYSTVAEVQTFTKRLLGGKTGFDSETNPTNTEVQTFLSYASNQLDVALRAEGFSTPIVNSTAKSVCDSWVTMRAVEFVELTQQGVGFNEEQGTRSVFSSLFDGAMKFAQEHMLGFSRLGVTRTQEQSDGLEFTAMDKYSERSDPDDSSREQPKFRRGLFDA